MLMIPVSVSTGTKASLRKERVMRSELVRTFDLPNDPIPFEPSKNVAPYREFTYYGPKGEYITASVEGSDLVMRGDPAVYADVVVVDYMTGKTVAQADGYGEIITDCSKLKVDGPYFISFLIEFSDHEVLDEAPVLSMNSDGEIFFVVSKAYDVNKRRMEKLFYYGDPYDAFLSEQKDIEFNQYDVKKLAEEITKDCTTDYDKVMAIYTYIVDNMYYDMDQLDYDNDIGYQDDVLTLTRRKIAICEGFSNVFVGLCRANGIPATEVYGSAYDYESLWLWIDVENDQNSNHAWAVVYLDGHWQIVDPTWDNYSTYDGGEYLKEESHRDWFLLPLESASYSHLFMNSDFSHTIISEGQCGSDARYKIDENGVCTIYGTGELKMPTGVNDFFEIRFDKNSNITAIAEEGLLNCDQLSNIILPDSVKKIGDRAFCSCEDLEYIYLPDSLQSIGEEAFYLCDKLAYCHVPDGVKISNYAFDNCPRLILDIESKKKISFDGYLVRPVKVIARDEL